MSERYNNSMDILSKIIPCKDYIDNKISDVFYGTNESGLDFSRKDMNRFKAYNSTFNDCKFNGAACDASVFQNISFVSCDFSGATFQDVRFTNCRFIDCYAKAVNFSRSRFIESEIENTTIIMSTLHQCYLERCSIAGGDYHTATLDGSKIIDSKIQNVDLSRLNLEFVLISNIAIEGNVILPPYQVAYILNGVKYAMENTNKYVLRTDNGVISGELFIDQLDLLLDFYKRRDEYFPTANILLAKGQADNALELIEKGIRSSIDVKDFRMLKNYCWMLKEASSVSIDIKHDIYKTISSYINSITMTQSEYYSYTLYMGEIRELLMNSLPGQPRLEIVICTDFMQNDLDKVYELFNFITDVMSETKSNNHVDFIEIRHNSPYEIILSCIDGVPELMYAVATIYLIVSKVIPKLLDVSKQSLEIAQQAQELHYNRIFKQHEMDSWKLETERKKLENEKIRLENLKLTKELRLSEPTIIGINEIRHTISASSISDTGNVPTSALMGDYRR